jgi:hypothetical protein
MEILDGLEPQFSPETVSDPTLLAREFGHNGLIASFTRQQDIHGHQENACN